MHTPQPNTASTTMARRGGGGGGGAGGGGRSSTGALFDPDFRQAFLDWLVTEQGKSVKSSQEYYYQLSDVTRVCCVVSIANNYSQVSDIANVVTN